MSCELCQLGHPRTGGEHYVFEKPAWRSLGACTNPDLEPVKAEQHQAKHRAQLAAIRERMERLTTPRKPPVTFTNRSAMREPGEDDGDE